MPNSVRFQLSPPSLSMSLEDSFTCQTILQGEYGEVESIAIGRAFLVDDRELREDVRCCLQENKHVEEWTCSPAAEAEVHDEFCDIILRFVVMDIPEGLRKMWQLEGVKIDLRLKGIHRGHYRHHERIPTVEAIHESEDPKNQMVEIVLVHVASRFVIEHFRWKASSSCSFLSDLYKHVDNRIGELAERCIGCGRRLYSCGVLPSICDDQLCFYQHTQLGLFERIAAPRVTPSVLSLLLFAFFKAHASDRREAVLVPLMEGSGLGSVKVVESIVDCPRSTLRSSASYAEFKRRLPREAKLVEWLVMSNPTFLTANEHQCPVDSEFLGTDKQFLFVADSPEKQIQFQALVDENEGRTRFLFHGSRIENWHAILRNGLKNMSGTPSQLNGARHGAGIYLSPWLALSLGYSDIGGSNYRRACREKKCCLYTEKASTLHVVALVEVVDTPDAYTTPRGGVVVVKDEKWCSIRMLLIYPGSLIADHKLRCGRMEKGNLCDLTTIPQRIRLQINSALDFYKLSVAQQATIIEPDGLTIRPVGDSN